MKMSFLNIRTKSQLKRNKTVRTSIPYTQVQSVGVLFSIEDKKKHDEIKDFIHRLERDGKKVKVMAYLPPNKDNYEFLFDFFTQKEISFWGAFTSETAVKFFNTPFDYLYYLDTKPNPMMLNILARSKARCRIGGYWENNKSFFEFMLSETSTTRNLIDSMYKYSTQLK
ncbi:MAG: hypothetical protein KF725_06820 [Cyclobacteriaceae bacterium]|nr:hypothetical protein [Cyclobacteriaceae bacterium]UYN88359.1 MAG: hypothetical protein KIT51_08990 [Cyclobacteriaceae bacterium]